MMWQKLERGIEKYSFLDAFEIFLVITTLVKVILQ